LEVLHAACSEGGARAGADGVGFFYSAAPSSSALVLSSLEPVMAEASKKATWQGPRHQVDESPYQLLGITCLFIVRILDQLFITFNRANNNSLF